MLSREELMKMATHCEICDSEPATELQGGLFNGQRNIWMCCKSCKQKIIDERKRDRRSNETNQTKGS